MGRRRSKASISIRPNGQRAHLHFRSWRPLAARRAKDYGYPADLFVNAGVNYIALDFIAATPPRATCGRWPSR